MQIAFGPSINPETMSPHFGHQSNIIILKLYWPHLVQSRIHTKKKKQLIVFAIYIILPCSIYEVVFFHSAQKTMSLHDHDFLCLNASCLVD